MEDFKLPVTYNGKEYLFTARLLKYTYTYKIEVEVNDSIIHIEKDDEGNWRAMVALDEHAEHGSIDRELIGQIMTSIEVTMGE